MGAAHWAQNQRGRGGAESSPGEVWSARPAKVVTGTPADGREGTQRARLHLVS